MEAKVISVVQSKGGIYKSSSIQALHDSMVRRGKKVLVIDADYSHNLSTAMNAKSEGVATLYDVLLEEDANRIPISEAIQKTSDGTLGDIVPGDTLLMGAEEILSQDFDSVYRLSEALEAVRNDYDYILIDSHPNALNRMISTILTASDYVLIPMFTDGFSLEGVSQVYQAVQKTRKRQNPKLRILGILLTAYDSRTNIAKQFAADMDEYAKRMGTILFKARIRSCVKVKEAQLRSKSVFEYAPKCSAVQDYTALTDEIFEILEA